ncbi:hypothetical protein CRUP_012574 [Coryphaenoides rupestris]|nr:hypothetical protein CRUP_012574 [Coryphaenoides rupestris]
MLQTQGAESLRMLLTQGADSLGMLQIQGAESLGMLQTQGAESLGMLQTQGAESLGMLQTQGETAAPGRDPGIRLPGGEAGAARAGRPAVIFDPDFLVERLRHERPEVFTEPVLSNLTRLIDLPGSEFSELLGEGAPKTPTGGHFFARPSQLHPTRRGGNLILRQRDTSASRVILEEQEGPAGALGPGEGQDQGPLRCGSHNERGPPIMGASPASSKTTTTMGETTASPSPSNPTVLNDSTQMWTQEKTTTTQRVSTTPAGRMHGHRKTPSPTQIPNAARELHRQPPAAGHLSMQASSHFPGNHIVCVGRTVMAW